MSLTYLQGKTWAQVTRDERFFCQHLYHLILRSPDVKAFVTKLNHLTEGQLNLDANVEWEIGYEVCFYRDLWFLREKKYQLESQKRTFDLCLFSQEEIVIIEAKAQQGFDSDRSQKDSFKNDKLNVEKLTGVKRVKLLGLASSLYLTEVKRQSLAHENPPLFDALINWADLAEHFGNDEILKRADNIFESGGRNNQRHMTLTQVQLRAKQVEPFFIGCEGGFDKFVEKHMHNPARMYETSEKEVINNNWFTSERLKELSAFQADA